ncbi:MAG TPA: DUF3488 and transglutaminase-like domain-containing protein [Lysobacter sp.]|nr:DUF3488 and transglutaminase-like domain-containing protein [Lysobacter sp.]
MADRTPTLALDPVSRRWALAAGALCLLPLLLALPGTLAATIATGAVLVALLSWKATLPTGLRALLALAIVALILTQSRMALGRDTGAALLAAMLALKPAEVAGLRDARSYVGFALFAPFATFLLDQGPLSLGLGLVAALTALAALQRLAELESGDAAPRPPLQRYAQVGRIVAVGLPLALAAFWLFPRFGSPLWGVPERALARTGLSDRMSPGDWIDLLADDAPALRVRFFGATPPTSQMYWRGPVLWHYDGRTWTRPQWLAALPVAAAEPGRPRWDYELEVEPTDRREVPALELPIDTPRGTLLTLGHTLSAVRPLSALTRWRLQAAAPARHEPELSPLLRRMALQLPAGYNPRTLALARQWRAQVGDDDAALMRRTLEWIRRDFAYSISAPPLGRNAIDEFLFDTREGYCEHYAAAFVFLMRAAGVPARVVTGYVGGYRNPLGGYWLVRRSDAHAWAEVWLPRRGWVRVDPTAAVAPERIYDTLDDRVPGAGGLLGAGAAPLFNVGDWVRLQWNDLVLGFNAERQQRLLQPLGIERLDSGALIALFALSAGLALAWMVWLTARGVREADPVLRAWHRLERRYRRLGLGRAPHEPAGAWVARVAAARPDLAPALEALSRRFVQWRYAARTSGPSAAREQRDLVRRLQAHRPRSLGDRR